MIQKFLVNTTKATIAHDDNLITGNDLTRNQRHQRVYIVHQRRRHRTVRNQRLQRPVHARRLEPVDRIRLRGGASQMLSMLTHAHGIGAGLYQCNNATTPSARTQTLQCRCNSRRVMRKIVLYRDTARPTQQFKSTLDTLEFFKRRNRHIRCNAGMSGCH